MQVLSGKIDSLHFLTLKIFRKAVQEAALQSLRKSRLSLKVTGTPSCAASQMASESPSGSRSLATESPDKL